MGEFLDELLRSVAPARRFEVGDRVRLTRGVVEGETGEVFDIWESRVGVADWVHVRLADGREVRALPSMLRLLLVSRDGAAP